VRGEALRRQPDGWIRWTSSAPQPPGTPVELAPVDGLASRDAVLLNRLLSSHPAHQALEDFPNADLVLILSEHLYNTLVAEGHTTLDAAAFRKVDVTVKDFRGHGWLWVPGADVHAMDLTSTVPPVSKVPRLSGTINQHAVASHGSAVFQAGKDMTLQRRDRE